MPVPAQDSGGERSGPGGGGVRGRRLGTVSAPPPQRGPSGSEGRLGQPEPFRRSLLAPGGSGREKGQGVRRPCARPGQAAEEPPPLGSTAVRLWAGSSDVGADRCLALIRD